jgi:hypothetical protein
MAKAYSILRWLIISDRKEIYTLLLFSNHRRNFFQQIHRLGRVRDPGRRTRQSSFEIVRSSAQELVANVQRPTAFDTAEVLLAGHHAP